MPKIVGNTVGVPNPKSDWNQTDATKADYIMNKPDLGIFATKKELEAIKVNGGGTTGGVSQEYVDNGLLPKLELWQANTEYKAGQQVFALSEYDEGYFVLVGLICRVNHISPDVSSPDVAEDFHDCWERYSFNAFGAVRDANGNIIHKTYVQKSNGFGLSRLRREKNPDSPDKTRTYLDLLYGVDDIGGAIIPVYTSDLTNDSGYITRTIRSEVSYPEIAFERNTTVIYDEITGIGDTLPVLFVEGEFYDDFESSVVFTTSDIVLPISHEGVSITWAGEDCSNEGYFYPQPNTTYELHAKKLGSMFSIRVGIIVAPHSTEEV